MSDRRWRYDAVPDEWSVRRSRSSWVGTIARSTRGELLKHGDLLHYDGLGPFKTKAPAEGYGPLDETSPPCPRCQAEAICADGVCGACGQATLLGRVRKLKVDPKGKDTTEAGADVVRRRNNLHRRKRSGEGY